MIEIPVLYAFSAGMVATVNPCGFAMLPAYVAYHLGVEEKESSFLSRGARGLLLALIATAGFVALFAVVGGVISLGGRFLIKIFPVAGFAIGVGLVLLGLWLLVTRRSLALGVTRNVRIPIRRGMSSIFLFGVAYGAASLSCTLPIFLVVVGSALALGGFFPALIQFVSYGLGMGLIITVVTIGVVYFKGAVSRALEGLVPYVERLGALALIGAGGYLIYYWLKNGVFSFF